jgi:hypothetical protein
MTALKAASLIAIGLIVALFCLTGAADFCADVARSFFPAAAIIFAVTAALGALTRFRA